jgi:transcription-repair coupling factor (superfamily II helicase)
VSQVFPLERVLSALRAAPNAAVDIAGVDAELSAYLTVALQARLGRPFVVVTPDASDARRIASDLAFFAGEATRVVLLPTVEASPYGDLSPDRGAVMELLAQLALLAWDQAGTFTVVSADGLCRRPIPRSVLLDKSYLVVAGRPLDREACLRALADGGYHAVSAVEDPGTFAVRGGIIDVFPPHLEEPVRIELWGDEVDSLKPFRLGTQRTYGATLSTLMLPPVREELLVPPFRDHARAGIVNAAAAAEIPTRKVQSLLADLANGIPFMGIEGFRPAFYEELGAMTDYFPADAAVLLLDPLGVADRIRAVNDLREREHADALRDHMPSLPASQHVQHPGEIQRFFASRALVRAHVLHIGGPGGGPGEDLLDLGDTPMRFEGPEDAIRFQVPREPRSHARPRSVAFGQGAPAAPGDGRPRVGRARQLCRHRVPPGDPARPPGARAQGLRRGGPRGRRAARVSAAPGPEAERAPCWCRARSPADFVCLSTASR